MLIHIHFIKSTKSTSHKCMVDFFVAFVTNTTKTIKYFCQNVSFVYLA